MPCNEEELNTTVLIFLNKSWWSVGKEGTTLTCGHHPQVSVCREIFHWQWRKIEWNFPWRAETWEGCRLTPFDTLVNVVPFLFHRSSRVVLKKNGPLCKIPEKLPKRRSPILSPSYKLRWRTSGTWCKSVGWKCYRGLTLMSNNLVLYCPDCRYLIRFTYVPVSTPMSIFKETVRAVETLKGVRKLWESFQEIVSFSLSSCQNQVSRTC